MKKLHRDMGTFALMMTGIGSIIGSGWANWIGIVSVIPIEAVDGSEVASGSNSVGM